MDKYCYFDSNPVSKYLAVATLLIPCILVILETNFYFLQRPQKNALEDWYKHEAYWYKNGGNIIEFKIFIAVTVIVAS